MDVAEKLIRAKTDLDNVYEAGKQAEKADFWSNYFPPSSEEEEQGNYTGFFSGNGWNADTFSKIIYPDYKITPLGTSGAQRMFYWFNRNRAITSNPNPPIDLTEFCKHADFSRCTAVSYTFSNARVENVTLDLSSCTNINYLFYNDNGGHVDKVTLKLTETTTTATNAFSYSYNLRELAFTEDSVIACSLNFGESSLNAESFVSVVEHFSTTKTGLTLTVKQSAVNNANWSKTAYASWDELKAIRPNLGFAYK